MYQDTVTKVLNVAETPSVAKSLAKILAPEHDPFFMRLSGSHKIYEFEYVINGFECRMLFTAVTGHLMELRFGDPFREQHSCNPAFLFEAPVSKFVLDDKLDIKEMLEKEARECQWLVLWLDCDREGENIAFEVINICLSVNRGLAVKRARFSALIDRDIHHAAQNLKEPNKCFADAVDARQELDLRVGGAFTRFQTMFLRDAFVIDSAKDDSNFVLSYDLCQFHTLRFIVDREKDIQSHQPMNFEAISCTDESNEGTAKFEWMGAKHSSVVSIFNKCLQRPIASVKDVLTRKDRRNPPIPLNTFQLQKCALKNFQMSYEHTMKVAEELYQAGFISYPRTKTNSFSSTDLRAIVEKQKEHPAWGSYAQQLLAPDSKLWRGPRSGGHDDHAYPPIHPTKSSSGESGWSNDHIRLYELVVRHFLACVSEPAVGNITTVNIEIAGEIFSAFERVIPPNNYLDVYIFESWGEPELQTYAPKQKFRAKLDYKKSGQTPPRYLSEAELLDCMDKESVGTYATRHDHIQKLLDCSYAEKVNNGFKPTDLGRSLVSGYNSTSGMVFKLWDRQEKVCLESDMNAVSEGNKSKAEVLKTWLQKMKACFNNVRQRRGALYTSLAKYFPRSNRHERYVQQKPDEFIRECGVCQEAKMVLCKSPDGKYVVRCNSYPECTNAIWLPGSVSKAVATDKICKSCTPGRVHLIQFTFRQLEIQPYYNTNRLACIGCDGHITKICRTGSRSAGFAGSDGILRQSREICGTGSRSTDGGMTSGSRGFQHANVSARSDAGGRGSGGRGAWGAGHATSGTVVSATGYPNSGRKCYTCGDPSHYSNICPERKCYICEDRSHYANICPNRRRGACFTCGSSSHYANICPRKK